jgi:hypothetical protein
VNVKDQKQREAEQMQVLRPNLGPTRRHKQRNIDIRIKLNQDNIGDEFRNYQQNCLRHLKQNGKQALTKVALQYQSHGKRDVGRPRIRWSEQDHLTANELCRTGATAIKLQRS